MKPPTIKIDECGVCHQWHIPGKAYCTKEHLWLKEAKHELTCSKCNMTVPFEHEAIAITVNACEFKDRVDEKACGIKQMSNFLRRLKDKETGEPRKLFPILLQPRDDEKLIQVETKLPADQPKEFEVTVDDAISIRISKDGRVTTESIK